MASLVHDTSPILRHILKQSHNKGLYYGLRDAILSRLVTMHQAPGASCGISLSSDLFPFIFFTASLRVIECNNDFLCSLHR